METTNIEKVYRISDDLIDIPDSYVVNDGEEVGRGNKIPLWLFGLLY